MLIGSFTTPLPGHERLEHRHVLFGEVVLPNNVLQGVEVTRDDDHGLDLVLTLSGAEDTTADGLILNLGKTKPDVLTFVLRKLTLISPRSTNKMDTKL